MKTFAIPTRKRAGLRRPPAPRITRTPEATRIARRAEIRHILHGPRLQAKLTVGAPDDAYEREADRVADAVMRMPEPRERIQRVCPECEEEMRRQPAEEPEEEEKLRRQPDEEEEPEELRRQPEEEAEEEEQEEIVAAKRRPGGVPEISGGLEASIQALRGGGGHPLPESERVFFEPRLGRDFCGVRLHDDSKAAQLARKVNARAFTVGRDIVFGHGEYRPGTTQGRSLLAHELTHVVQQEGDPSTKASMKAGSSPA